MDKKEISNKAKIKIDQIFNNLDELEHSAKEISDEHKAQLNKEMSEMRKSRDTLSDLYENLEKASEDSLHHLQSAFEQMSAVMNKRINEIKIRYQEAVEA